MNTKPGRLTIGAFEEEVAKGRAQTIAQAIANVMLQVGYVQKKGFNTEHKYKFTAVGDVLAKAQPALAEEGLIIIQQEREWTWLEQNRVLSIMYEFYLEHTSGEKREVPIRKSGLSRFKFASGGIDDKAVNKCATSAHKYFLIELLKIPTGDIPDPDSDAMPSAGQDENGDDGSDDQKPAKRDYTEAEKRGFAENWAREALDTIKGLDRDGLFEWENGNSETLTKLAKHTDLHAEVVAAIQARYQDIN